MTGVYLLTQEQLAHYQRDIDDCLDAEPILWSRRFESKDALWQRAFDDYIQIWAVCDSDLIQAVFMSEVVHGPLKVLRVFWAHGHTLSKPRVVTGVTFVLKAFALRHDCKEIEIVGRRGWERALRAEGYEFACTTLRLPVSKDMKGH